MRAHDWKIRGRLSPPRPQCLLTFTEVRALRQAHSTGRFSIRSLAKIYDVNWGTAASALKDTYKPRTDY
jgi:hypothetical protein